MATTPATPRPALRAATEADLAAVESLLASADLPTAGVAEVFSAHPEDFVVAETPGELVGVAGLEVRGRDALLRSVAVRPEWRQHGVGRAVVRAAIARGEARGLRALYLLTTTAEHYFPRFGFAPLAREAVPAEIRCTAEFTSACPASAVVMAKSLEE